MWARLFPSPASSPVQLLCYCPSLILPAPAQLLLPKSTTVPLKKIGPLKKIYQTPPPPKKLKKKVSWRRKKIFKSYGIGATIRIGPEI